MPDEIIAAPGIPHTRTGKKLEIPIKSMFQGADLETIFDRQSIDDAKVLQWYIALASGHASRQQPSESVEERYAEFRDDGPQLLEVALRLVGERNRGVADPANLDTFVNVQRDGDYLRVELPTDDAR